MKDEDRKKQLNKDLTLFYLYSHFEYEIFKIQVSMDELIDREYSDSYFNNELPPDVERISSILEMCDSITDSMVSETGQELCQTLTDILSLDPDRQMNCLGFPYQTDSPATEADRLVNLFSQIDATDREQYINRCMFRMEETARGHEHNIFEREI